MTRSRALFVGALSLAVPACSREAAGPAPDAAAPVVSAKASALALPLRDAALPVSSQGDASAPLRLCEVEFRGKVDGVPAGRRAEVFVSDGDCLQGTGRLLGIGGTGPKGEFFIEVFSRWGADLTLCAAITEDGGDTATWYGRAAGPFHAEKDGEVEFNDTKVTVSRGPAKAFARRIRRAQEPNPL